MPNAIPLRRNQQRHITTEIVTLSPPEARRMLDHNTRNRTLNDGDVLKWATEMEAGRWELNGEPIKFSDTGVLLDGQHRLTALSLLADPTKIDFIIMRGLPEHTQSTMDQGRNRRLSDILTLNGVEATSSLGAAVTAYLIWAEGLLFTERRQQLAQITKPRANEWAITNPDIVELLRRGLGFRKIRMRPSVVGVVYARIAEVNGVDVADEFFQSLTDGLNLPPGSPIVALRNRLDNIAGLNSNGVRSHISNRDLIGLVVTAFNAWLKGRSLTKIQRPTGTGYTQATFPEISR